MTFRIRTDRHFNNGGETYTATVVAKKLNGYKVVNPEGEITFLCNEDIEVLSLTEEERNMKIEW